MIDLNNEKLQILRFLHEKSMHRKREETYYQIADCYWWKRLYQNVKWHVKSCVSCQFRALKKKEKKLHFTYVNIAWKKIKINVMHMLFLHDYNYLIIIRNDFFKWMKWRAIISIIAETIMKFLWKNIFCKYRIFWKMMMNEDSKNK